MFYFWCPFDWKRKKKPWNPSFCLQKMNLRQQNEKNEEIVYDVIIGLLLFNIYERSFDKTLFWCDGCFCCLLICICLTNFLFHTFNSWFVLLGMFFCWVLKYALTIRMEVCINKNVWSESADVVRDKDDGVRWNKDFCYLNVSCFDTLDVDLGTWFIINSC